MATIAIGEWMDGHEPMVQTHRDFIGRIGLVINPILYISKHNSNFFRNA